MLTYTFSTIATLRLPSLVDPLAIAADQLRRPPACCCDRRCDAALPQNRAVRTLNDERPRRGQRRQRVAGRAPPRVDDQRALRGPR
mmetsp:Transcript_13214/g.45210  ORF Transcript_13214/g.45210 Transcript_13214/m.45210 type:complete len:86 (-) Transcript_13214:945-1202(-)